MGKVSILAVFAASVVALVSVQIAVGQEGPTVEILNPSGEVRKVCFHRVDRNRTGVEKVKALPLGCYRLQNQQFIKWKRADSNELQVKVYRPQLIDKLLGMGRMPGSTRSIEIEASGDLTFRDEPVTGTRYILKVCNKNSSQPVFLALGFRMEFWVTEGWWSVKKGACIELPVSRMLYRKWDFEFGLMPGIYFYARTYGEKPVFWRGGQAGRFSPRLCYDETKAFTWKKLDIDWPYADIKLQTCAGPQERKVMFRFIPPPKARSRYYYLTF